MRDAPKGPHDRSLIWLAVLCLAFGFLLIVAVLPAHCEERHETAFRLTAGAMVTLGAVDVAQTAQALHSGQFREGNPAVASIAGQPWLFGAVKAGTLTATWALARHLRQTGHGHAAWAALIGVTAGQALAVAWNTNQLVRR